MKLQLISGETSQNKRFYRPEGDLRNDHGGRVTASNKQRRRIGFQIFFGRDTSRIVSTLITHDASKDAPTYISLSFPAMMCEKISCG
jgi:hypothetical protein